ncbi:response regulator transcription factor [Janthinobacterium sp. PC23-8]|uniref:response regulator transcription factor n=1 Tax=Janthinobacterium sp. PC23-8 TaxID=2012679 RepID=UPI000B9604ED|nr:response regulator [Janthinobacterium sp. PC23-8]OYO28080.1 two-component system response regulator [Janthinobacterium sp. PC23-8]
MSESVTNQVHIAVIDDHESVRSALASLLRSYGYLTSSFDCAESMLAGAPSERYQCIVTDLQMPGMSGIELLEQLRRQGSETPLIMITAFPEPAVRQRVLQAGATCFLGKPFQSNDLVRCIRQACKAL